MPKAPTLGTLLTAAFLLTNTPVFASQNLLSNSSFEDGESAWTKKHSTTKVELVSSNKNTGNYALAVSKVENKKGWTYVYQDVASITDNEIYTLSGWVYFNDEKIKYSRLRVEWLAAGEEVIRKDEVTASERNSLFQYLSLDSESPENTQKARIELYVYLSEENPTQETLFDDIAFLLKEESSDDNEGEETYPENIYINEFLANPVSGSEWVELYSNNTTAVSLENWQLDDIEGGSSPQTFSTTPQPLSYTVIYLSSHKLNNSGDRVRLIRPDGTVVAEVVYTSSTKGYTYAKDSNGNWRETTTATPGEANIFSEPTNKDSSSGDDETSAEESSPAYEDDIQNIKKLPLGTKISVKAWVTAEPEILGKRVMYIEDKTDGIKVDLDKEYSNIELGDYLELSCSLEESRSEYYIKMAETSSLTILKKDKKDLDPAVIRTGLVGELFEGRLVRVAGNVVETSGETFWLDDGSGKAKIYIRDSTEIDKPATPEGAEIEVRGIVSQYGEYEDGTPNFRLLPRYQDDIQILPTKSENISESVTGSVLGLSTLKELPQTGADTYTSGILILLLGLSLRFIRPLRSHH